MKFSNQYSSHIFLAYFHRLLSLVGIFKFNNSKNTLIQIKNVYLLS